MITIPNGGGSCQGVFQKNKKEGEPSQPAGGPAAAAFHTAGIAVFGLAVKGQKSPPFHAVGAAICRPGDGAGNAGAWYAPLRCHSRLPLALVGLPPRRKRRVFRGEGGGDIWGNPSNVTIFFVEWTKNCSLNG